MPSLIYYFSATGNSRWAAELLASLTGDSACDITMSAPEAPEGGQQRTGLVFPVYAWGPPEPVLRFAAKLKGKGGFTFGVCTCGSEAGYTMEKLARVLPLDSSYSLVMPNNYLIGSELQDRDAALDKLREARVQLERIAGELLEKKRVRRVQVGSLPRLKSGIICFFFNRFGRSAKPFHTLESCNGCGLCTQMCKKDAIG